MPQDYGVDILIHGSDGSFIFDIAADRRVLKLPDGTTETANPTPGASQYSCEDPTNMVVDIALGHGVNQSTGHVSVRAIETLQALIASGRENGTEFKITTTNQKAEIA